MKKYFRVTFFVFLLGFFWLPRVAHAVVTFTSIPFTFDGYSDSDLDNVDYNDESSFGSVPLGFSVTLGGASYDGFNMDSNGDVQLLSGSQTPTDYGYGTVNDLISADPASTYLLAAYDDLDSSYFGYFGYKLFSDNAVFYYNTETYADGDSELLNEFEIILRSNGEVQWNFNFSDYENYDYDLFSGLYFGNTGTQAELYSNTIPQEESWLYQEPANNLSPNVPEPSTFLLLGTGLLGFLFRRKLS